MIFRWETIQYVKPKSGRVVDTDKGRFTVRRASLSSRSFLVRHCPKGSQNITLFKNTFSSVEEGMQAAEGWYEKLPVGGAL